MLRMLTTICMKNKSSVNFCAWLPPLISQLFHPGVHHFLQLCACYVLCVYRDKSDLTATYREVAMLGEVLVNSISHY